MFVLLLLLLLSVRQKQRKKRIKTDRQQTDDSPVRGFCAREDGEKHESLGLCVRSVPGPQ